MLMMFVTLVNFYIFTKQITFNNFSKAFSLVGMAEGEIKELIIAFGMGVQMTQYLTRSEKDQSNIQGAIDNYG